MLRLNQAYFSGKVTSSPEMKTVTNANLPLLTFAICHTPEKGKDVCLDVNLWRDAATEAQMFVKEGAQVMVVGRLEMNQWKDASGATRQKIRLCAYQCTPIGGSQSPTAPVQQPAPEVYDAPPESSTPF